MLTDADQGRRGIIKTALSRREIRTGDKRPRQNGTGRDVSGFRCCTSRRCRFIAGRLCAFLIFGFRNNADFERTAGTNPRSCAFAAVTGEFGFHFVAHDLAAFLFTQLEGIVNGLIIFALGGVLRLRNLLGNPCLLIFLLSTQCGEFIGKRVKPFFPNPFLRCIRLFRSTFLFKPFDLLP